ncbi:MULTISPECIES: hypothetical protein [unclassified Streptomyces]|uniref:hypothetical protein n=1 Tax=unclassified Streptomyces TaxID=2593676 RepID=UPI00378D4B03
MHLPYDDIAEQHADLMRLLLPHLNETLPDGQFILGVLPPPPPAEAVRVATGSSPQAPAEDLTVWEIPLRTDLGSEDLLGGDEVLGLVRALHTGTQIYSSSRLSTVMGMHLVLVDPTNMTPAPPNRTDITTNILRTLVRPWTEEQPDPRLRGYLRCPDRLRLYLDRENDTTVVAADVRPDGAVTAVLAALDSLLSEPGQQPDGDPHCSRLLDLTRW